MRSSSSTSSSSPLPRLRAAGGKSLSQDQEEDEDVARERQRVLQGLAHGVALGHDALAAVVPRARGVGHEGGAADDALQTLLQGGPEAGLAERQRVQDDLVLEDRDTMERLGQGKWREEKTKRKGETKIIF